MKTDHSPASAADRGGWGCKLEEEWGRGMCDKSDSTPAGKLGGDYWRVLICDCFSVPETGTVERPRWREQKRSRNPETNNMIGKSMWKVLTRWLNLCVVRPTISVPHATIMRNFQPRVYLLWEPINISAVINCFVQITVCEKSFANFCPSAQKSILVVACETGLVELTEQERKEHKSTRNTISGLRELM